MAVRRKFIREIVEKLLRDHGVEPGAVPVDKIARALDIEISLDKVDDDLSGFLFRDKESSRTVIGANSSHHKNRQRFTIAHELGHFLLHEGEMIHLDEKSAGLTVNFRDGESSTGENNNEKEANYFAAELLMPAKFLREELQGKHLDLFEDSETLNNLAKKYKVSPQALTFRLTNLGYIKL
jgi:Zn-dependent peptidase ImmA (M78 family)